MKATLMALALFVCVIGCAASKAPPNITQQGAVIDAGGSTPAKTAPQPAPSIPPAPPPPVFNQGVDSEGLVTITVSIPKEYGEIDYAITDVGYTRYPAASDGKVYIRMTTGDHAINLVTKDGKWAVDKGIFYFPIWVNGIRLTKLRPDVKGGMLYFYIWPSGQIGTEQP